MKKFSFAIGVLALSWLAWVSKVMASIGSGIAPGPGNWSWIQWLIEHGFIH
jgi:hypothetical protein